VWMLPYELSHIIKCSKVSKSFLDLITKALKVWTVVEIDESFGSCRAEDLARTLRWLTQLSGRKIQFDYRWGCHVHEEFTSAKTSHFWTADGWLFRPTPRHLAQCRLFKLVPELLYAMRIVDRFPLIRFRNSNEDLIHWLKNSRSVEISELIGVRLNGSNPSSVFVLENSWETFVRNINPCLQKLCLGLGQDLLSSLPSEAYSSLMQSLPTHSLKHLQVNILAPENVPEKLLIPGNCPHLMSLSVMFIKDRQNANSSFSSTDSTSSNVNCSFCLDDSVTASLANAKHLRQLTFSHISVPDSLLALPNLIDSLEVLELHSLWISGKAANFILSLKKLKKLQMVRCTLEDSLLLESLCLLQRLEQVKFDFLSPEPTIESQEKAMSQLLETRPIKEFSFRCNDSCLKPNKIVRRWSISTIRNRFCQNLSLSIRNDEIFDVYEALCRSIAHNNRETCSGRESYGQGEKVLVFHISKGSESKYAQFLHDFPDFHDSLILMAKNVGIKISFIEAETSC